MKKQQKINELRTAAKVKVAEIETKIAFARSEAAKERAHLMWDRASELDGLDAGSTERFDVLAKYRAKLAGVNEKLEATVAQCKYEIQQAKIECEKECAAAEDDPEPENQQSENQQPSEEPAVWVDGRQHTAVIVARRMLRKLPRVAPGCAFNISVRYYGDDISIELEAYNPKRKGYSFESVILRSDMTAVEQEKAAAEWMERAAALIKYEGNSHVAEPIASALDACFGGDPVEQVDNLISDTIRDGKEGRNE